MSGGVRLFVLIVFSTIGVAFGAVTGALVYEFNGWSLGDNHAALIALATLNSHLFLFFPTLGVLALFAFYIPACVFVDLYWRRIPYGRLRFVLGAAALIALSFYAAGIMRSAAPALWQIAPQALQSDNGGAEVCAPYTTVSRTCETCGVDNIAPERICTTRQPMLKAVREVRQVARQSFGLSPFVRACSTSPLLEPAPESGAFRYCFVTGSKVDAQSCCAAKQRFTEEARELNPDDASLSLTHHVHGYSLPVIVFFMLVLFIIGALLVARRNAVDDYYPDLALKVERGVLFGALAMIVWPLSNHAFIESSAVLYGSEQRSLYVQVASVISAMFGVWALMILFYFYRKAEEDLEVTGKILGVTASVLTVANYSDIIDYAQRFLGAGASWGSLMGLAVFLTIVIARLSFWKSRASRTTSLARSIAPQL